MAISSDKWAPACAAVLEDWLTLVGNFVAAEAQHSVDSADRVEALSDEQPDLYLSRDAAELPTVFAPATESNVEDRPETAQDLDLVPLVDAIREKPVG